MTSGVETGAVYPVVSVFMHRFYVERLTDESVGIASETSHAFVEQNEEGGEERYPDGRLRPLRREPAADPGQGARLVEERHEETAEGAEERVLDDPVERRDRVTEQQDPSPTIVE